MDEGGAALVALGLQEGLLVAAAVGHDAGAHALDRFDLQLIGVERDVDGGRDAEGQGGVGDPLAVVAGGGGDDAVGAFLGGHPDHLVERPAHLEGADRLDTFQLQVDLAAGLGGEGARELERRGAEVGGEVGGRLLDGGGGDAGGLQVGRLTS